MFKLSLPCATCWSARVTVERCTCPSSIAACLTCPRGGWQDNANAGTTSSDVQRPFHTPQSSGFGRAETNMKAKGKQSTTQASISTAVPLLCNKGNTGGFMDMDNGEKSLERHGAEDSSGDEDIQDAASETEKAIEQDAQDDSGKLAQWPCV